MTASNKESEPISQVQPDNKWVFDDSEADSPEKREAKGNYTLEILLPEEGGYEVHIFSPDDSIPRAAKSDIALRGFSKKGVDAIKKKLSSLADLPQDLRKRSLAIFSALEEVVPLVAVDKFDEEIDHIALAIKQLIDRNMSALPESLLGIARAMHTGDMKEIKFKGNFAFMRKLKAKTTGLGTGLFEIAKRTNIVNPDPEQKEKAWRDFFTNRDIISIEITPIQIPIERMTYFFDFETGKYLMSSKG